MVKEIGTECRYTVGPTPRGNFTGNYSTVINKTNHSKNV